MKKNKKLRGIEALKSRYGLMFVSIWVIGFLMFFLLPLCQSFIYAFCSVSIGSESGSGLEFVGLDNFLKIINEDPDYTTNLSASLSSILYSLPLILIVSLVLALILNQKFRGRLFFRAIYFLPVIIASGVVMDLISGQLDSAGQVATSVTENMFSVSDIMNVLNLPASIATTVQKIISQIFSLLWQCGVQIVLFIAGLQSIPSSLYEASRVEGASKWEDFWFITFPMLSRVTLLVGVFTMIELFTATTSPVIDVAYAKMSTGIYDISSAMLWLYFAAVAVIMGLVILLYNKLLVKRWE